MRIFLRNEKGQFIPLTAMVIFSAALLMIAGVNIYRVSKNKLQVQNLADAAALAVASMEASAVNTSAGDRNEWMNNFYSKDYKRNSYSLPNISDAPGFRFPKGDNGKQLAQGYANLVASINKAQRMFNIAYNNFLGAGGNTASGGSGTAALADILSQIDGLQDPQILAVWVYNDDTAKPSDQTISNTGTLSMDVGSKLIAGMRPLKFVMEDIPIYVDGKPTTLTKLAGGDPNKEEDRVGWMRPDWMDNQMNVQVTKGNTEPHWGVGVTIVKAVPLYMFPLTMVRATSHAYVVDAAGVITRSASNLHQPAKHFRPTFYAKLAYHP